MLPLPHSLRNLPASFLSVGHRFSDFLILINTTSEIGPMQTVIHIIGDRAVLQLQGRFDWSSQRDFHKTVDTVLDNFGTNEIQVDLGGVDYIDNTALGLLLVLREEALVRNKGVSLANCRGGVKVVLDIAKFDRVFAIS